MTKNHTSFMDVSFKSMFQKCLVFPIHTYLCQQIRSCPKMCRFTLRFLSACQIHQINVRILVLYHTIKAITIIAFSKDAIKLGQHLVLMMLLQLHKLPTKSFSERQLGSLLDAVACRRYLDFYDLIEYAFNPSI